MSDSNSTFTAPVDFRLTNNPPTGISDPVVAGALDDVYNSMQQVFNALVDQCGIGSQASALWDQLAGTSSTIVAANMNRFYVETFEPVSFGSMLNLVLDAGVIKAQLASAVDNTKPAQGFCNSAGVIAGKTIEMVLHTGMAKITGLTIGTKYYLSAVTPGLITAARPVAAGNIEQYLGVAITVEDFFFYTHHWIQH